MALVILLSRMRYVSASRCGCDDRLIGCVWRLDLLHETDALKDVHVLAVDVGRDVTASVDHHILVEPLAGDEQDLLEVQTYAGWKLNQRCACFVAHKSILSVGKNTSKCFS